MLVDSHCHLDFPDFQDDQADVLARAKDAGVQQMLTICTQVTKFDQVLAIAQAHPHIHCSVGIHPHEADSEPETQAQTLLDLADAHPDHVVAFGETGLDYFYENSPKEAQKRNFRAHLQAARDRQLPIIIHARDADDDTIEILRDEAEQGAFPGVIHCFTAGQALADAALDLGLYISISGIVTFKKADALRDVVKSVPLDRLLVETDSPYLAPVPNRGKRNEPANVKHTAAYLADFLGVPFDELAARTTENYFKLFQKAAA